VVSRFTWQVTAAGTAACYDALLEGKPLPGAPEIDAASAGATPVASAAGAAVALAEADGELAC
jgi:hypothetical protein